MNYSEKFLQLASASPRRKALLEQIGVAFKVVSANINEQAFEHEAPEELVQRLSLAKATVGFNASPLAPTLGADTIVSVDNCSEVCFRTLSDQEIQRYCLSGEPDDKAGSYGIQGRAAVFITSIQGSYSGVMGLPLFETGQLLEQFDIQYWSAC